MKQSTLCDINSRSLPSRSSSVEGSLTPPSKGSYHALPEAVATQTKDNTNSRRMAKVKSDSHASDQRKKSPYEVSETTRVTSEQNERRSIRHYVCKSKLSAHFDSLWHNLRHAASTARSKEKTQIQTRKNERAAEQCLCRDCPRGVLIAAPRLRSQSHRTPRANRARVPSFATGFWFSPMD